MNKSKLYKGMIVKNYKEMCILLDENILFGNSKKSQLKKWKLHFDYCFDGIKIKVLDVYDISYPEINLLKKDGFIHMIGNCLLYMLNEFNEDYLIITKKEIMKNVGLVNDNFGKRDIAINLYDKNGITISNDSVEFNINNFYEYSKQRLSVSINQSIEKLEKLNLIKKTDIYMIIENENNKGKIYLKNRVADREEQSQIEIIYNELKDEMNVNEIKYLSKDLKELFYENLKKKVTTKLGCANYYKAYKIEIKEIKKVRLINNDEFNYFKKEINKKMLKSIYSLVENKLKNQDMKIMDMLLSKTKTKDIYLYSDDYVDIQNILIDYFINTNRFIIPSQKKGDIDGEKV